MGYSETRHEYEAAPDWARYAVLICHGHTVAGRPERDPVQYFTARRDAERFAAHVARYFPARTGDELTLWALVYALSSSGRERLCSSGVCYLAFDPGASVLKRHAIEAGYGERAAPTLAGAPY